MAFTLELATAEDLTDMATIMSEAVVADTMFTTMKGSLSHEDEIEYLKKNFEGKFRGGELGACQTWKVVNEHG
jgi:hypothetical protein